MPGSADPEHRRAIRPHFDAAFYLTVYNDIREAGVDPLEHFLLQGWREGRNPSRTFDVDYYLRVHADVAATGINPLLHYALAGAAEGRQTRRPLDEARRILAAAQSPLEQARHWSGAEDTSEAVPVSAALIRGVGPTGLILSVSHDDYLANFGGVQNVIADEQGAFAGDGWSYLNVSPAAPLPMLAPPKEAEAYRVRLRLDGVSLGVVRFADLIRTVAELSGQSTGLRLIVHHLMGHVPELITILAAAARSRPILWVHDFFTLCSSYSLMRNYVKFCGAPSHDSPACAICSFGVVRREHLSRMRDFFDATKPFVLAPSRPALAFWQSHAGLPHAGSEVLPPARLLMAAPGCDPQLRVQGLASHKRLRVAFLGAPVFHKGWPVFEELAHDLATDDRYSFHHLGMSQSDRPSINITNVPVHVTPGNREAMVEAVAEQRIDVAVNWSLWPETFCFTVHEALAGGAFVVAHAGAGNVGPTLRINAPAQGCIIDGEADLARLFQTGEIWRLVARSRRRRGALLLGGGTADWLRRRRSDALGMLVAAGG